MFIWNDSKSTTISPSKVIHENVKKPLAINFILNIYHSPRDRVDVVIRISTHYYKKLTLTQAFQLAAIYTNHLSTSLYPTVPNTFEADIVLWKIYSWVRHDVHIHSYRRPCSPHHNPTIFHNAQPKYLQSYSMQTFLHFYTAPN